MYFKSSVKFYLTLLVHETIFDQNFWQEQLLISACSSCANSIVTKQGKPLNDSFSHICRCFQNFALCAFVCDKHPNVVAGAAG